MAINDVDATPSPKVANISCVNYLMKRIRVHIEALRWLALVRPSLGVVVPRRQSPQIPEEVLVDAVSTEGIRTRFAMLLAIRKYLLSHQPRKPRSASRGVLQRPSPSRNLTGASQSHAGRLHGRSSGAPAVDHPPTQHRRKDAGVPYRRSSVTSAVAPVRPRSAHRQARRVCPCRGAMEGNDVPFYPIDALARHAISLQFLPQVTPPDPPNIPKLENPVGLLKPKTPFRSNAVSASGRHGGDVSQHCAFSAFAPQTNATSILYGRPSALAARHAGRALELSAHPPARFATRAKPFGGLWALLHKHELCHSYGGGFARSWADQSVDAGTVDAAAGALNADFCPALAVAEDSSGDCLRFIFSPSAPNEWLWERGWFPGVLLPPTPRNVAENNWDTMCALMCSSFSNPRP